MEFIKCRKVSSQNYLYRILVTLFINRILNVTLLRRLLGDYNVTRCLRQARSLRSLSLSS